MLGIYFFIYFGMLSKLRNSKKHRIGTIIILIIILAIIAFIFEKVRWLMIGFIILMLGALGMEVYDYDLDLGKLWETGSISESRVETVKDSDGNSVRLITGNCNRAEFDLNCNDFSTQGEAQAKYNACADEIASNNPGIDVKKLDIYGLDGDNDGIVCEALPAN